MILHSILLTANGGGSYFWPIIGVIFVLLFIGNLISSLSDSADEESADQYMNRMRGKTFEKDYSTENPDDWQAKREIEYPNASIDWSNEYPWPHEGE